MNSNNALKPVSENNMTPAAFKRWRKSLKLSQKEAAHALGLKRRILQYYEKGERNGGPVEIPKTVRLACYALAHGCDDYAGPGEPVKGRETVKDVAVPD
jgi:transcriptional regulator with XRE-family HTH domain